MDAANIRLGTGTLLMALLVAIAGLSGCNVMSGGNLGISNALARAQMPPESNPPLRPTSPASNPIVQTASSAKPIPQIRVVAVIGSDCFITDDEVWQLVRQAYIFGLVKPSSSMTELEQEVFQKELFDKTLKDLIEREIILNDFFSKLKKNKPTAIEDFQNEAKKIATRNVNELRKRVRLQSEAALIEAFDSVGISYSLLMKQFERNAMLQLYLDSFLRDKGKTISALEVDRYYRDHPEEFKIEEQFTWQHLFVSASRFSTVAEAEAAAQQYRTRAVNGDDFAALVKKHGHGDSPLRNGAGVGSKRTEIQPVYLAQYVAALKAGEVSQVIPTEHGFHIVKMVERTDEGIAPFDSQVQAYIQRKLTAIAKDQERLKLIAQLLQQTTVKIFTD